MALVDWQDAGSFTDIKYHKAEGIAKITINRPEVRNAFRPLTVTEMRRALNDARDDHTIGVIVLTGEGPMHSARAGTNEFEAMPDTRRTTRASCD